MSIVNLSLTDDCNKNTIIKFDQHLNFSDLVYLVLEVLCEVFDAFYFKANSKITKHSAISIYRIPVICTRIIRSYPGHITVACIDVCTCLKTYEFLFGENPL